MLKEYEYFTTITIPNGLFFVIRCDLSGFHRKSEELSLKKPFDEDFHRAMLEIMLGFFKDSTFNPVFGTTHSDEISVLFAKEESMHGRRVEKFVSKISSWLSVSLSLKYRSHLVFDARVVLLPTKTEIREYFINRQDDAFRNCLNSNAYYKLLQSGLSARDATDFLSNKKASEIHEYLFSNYTINVANLPIWMKRGSAIAWKEYEKGGYNPISQTDVVTTRRKPRILDTIPVFREVESFPFL